MLPVNESHKLYNKEVKYFHDDTYKSYFRRLTFTPDGNLLITPAGCVETEDCKKALNCTYLFALDNFSQYVYFMLKNSRIIIIKCLQACCYSSIIEAVYNSCTLLSNFI